MTKENLVRALAILMASAASAAPAIASEVYIYSHNGSVVSFGIVGEQLRIQYDRPRPALTRAGIEAGTVLFEGTVSGDRVEGNAYTFRPGCPPASYAVIGRFVVGDSVELRGPAPTWGTGCEITGYSARSPHARLVFDYAATDH
jgi:hypothetical protein